MRYRVFDSLLLLQRHSQVEMRIRGGGVDLQRFAEMLDGFIRLALRRQHQPEIAVRIGVVWLVFEGISKMLDCLVQLPLIC